MEWKMPERFPNLYLVGAAKAGTTTLHALLSRHPDIYAPQEIKEMGFMAYEGTVPPLEGPKDRDHAQAYAITDRVTYLACYAAGHDRTWLLDASPVYLRNENAPQRISAYASDARVIIMLRNPIECAFSWYAMMRRDGREPSADFLQAFALSASRIAARWEWGWDYQNNNLFAAQIRRYLALIPTDRLLILNYDEWKSDPSDSLKKIASFLSIDPSLFPPKGERKNSAPTRRQLFYTSSFGRAVRPIYSLFVRALPKSLRNQFGSCIFDRPALRMSQKEQHVLQDYYLRDIEELESILGWDLSSWKNSEPL
jgi:hypothetical protein